ncbi:MAG: DUF2802 domain-containing protein [Nitrospirae bacterium]|nr:DUF2802 domain-containing protein [Nitrospirota bacterium]
MSDPILLVIALDFLILLLCLVILFDRRRGKLPKEVTELPETVGRLMREGEEFLSRADGEMKEKRASFERMLQEIQTQGRHLGEKSTEAKHVIKQMGGAVPQAAVARPESSNGGQEPYEVALRLYEEGMGVQEISQKLHLTKSELELVLGLHSARGAPSASLRGRREES